MPDVPRAVLIAGTNGKGSTASLIEAIARAGGYSTGLFTSPHLERLGEQVRLQGEPLSEDDLGQLLETVLETAREVGVAEEITAFEALTGAANLAFARANVDLAILESGMGGARDATNVCQPIVSLITNVEMDHASHLGKSIQDIAAEKAGIFRYERPAVWGWCTAAVDAELTLRARALRARPINARLRLRSITSREKDGRQKVAIETDWESYEVDLPLAGDHQVVNLGVAIIVCEALRELGYDLDPETVAAGAAACVLPGRLERLRGRGRRQVILDVAHNPAGAKVLGRWLRQRKMPYDLLFGCFADKDAAGMLGHLVGRAREIVLTRPNDPRAADPATLRDNVQEARILRLEEAFGETDREDEVPLVVTGSTRLVGDVRTRLTR